MDRPRTKKAKILHLREFLEGNRILPEMDIECTLLFMMTQYWVRTLFMMTFVRRFRRRKVIARQMLELHEAYGVHIHD